MDEAQAVYFELKPDECSLHEARIIHGARANTSDKRRAGYTMRYFPTTTKVYPEKNVGPQDLAGAGRGPGGERVRERVEGRGRRLQDPAFQGRA